MRNKEELEYQLERLLSMREIAETENNQERVKSLNENIRAIQEALNGQTLLIF